DPVLDPARPTVGVVFYRAHVLSGNTQFVDDLCAALREKGANALPVFCYSLRPDERGAVPALEALAERGAAAVITTLPATGGAAGLGAPVVAYRTVPDRVARAAGVAVRLARLGRVPNVEKRVAIVLSAYPTKWSRLGNAVGLDTPASVIELLHELHRSGYRVDRIPPDGDALMAEDRK